MNGDILPCSIPLEIDLFDDFSVPLLGGGGKISSSIICADCFLNVFVDPNAVNGDILPCSIPLEIDLCDDFSLPLLGDGGKISFSVICADCFLSVFVGPKAVNGDILPCSILRVTGLYNDSRFGLLGDGGTTSCFCSTDFAATFRSVLVAVRCCIDIDIDGSRFNSFVLAPSSPLVESLKFPLPLNELMRSLTAFRLT